MNKNSWKFIFYLAVFSLVLFAPQIVWGATVYVSSERDVVKVGDTIILNVRLDTQNTAVNVVEGEMFVKAGVENIEVRDINTAGSNLSFWSRRPSWDLKQAVVSFSGGEPGGFNKPDGVLFKVALIAQKAGQVIFAPSNFSVYANDGKGTILPVTTRPFVLQISDQAVPGEAPVDEWNKIIVSDQLSPEFLSANIGSDPSLYDGKLFVFINAYDYQSGIAYFEIKEVGDPTVQTGSNYILQDQTRRSTVTITAFDKAGNSRSLVVKPQSTITTAVLDKVGKKFGMFNVVLLLVVVVGLAIVSMFVFKKKKVKK